MNEPFLYTQLRVRVDIAKLAERRSRVALARLRPRWVWETDDVLERLIARREAAQAWVKVFTALVQWMQHP